jgi:hypothetical protein
MAHREQHGDREAKKPKKEMPEGGMTTQPTKWAADEVVEARIDSKALGSVPERRSHDPAPETYGIPDAQAFADRLWLLRPRARQAVDQADGESDASLLDRQGRLLPMLSCSITSLNSPTFIDGCLACMACVRYRDGGEPGPGTSSDPIYGSPTASLDRSSTVRNLSSSAPKPCQSPAFSRSIAWR